MTVISKALRENKNTRITEFKLSRNKKIQSDGAKALASYFNSYKTLELLEISGCCIGSEGMIVLLESIKESALEGNLKHVDISDNKIDCEEAVDKLCEFLTIGTDL